MNEVLIRAGEEKDLPRLTEIYNYYVENTAISFDIGRHTIEDRKALWFSKYSDTGIYRLLVAEIDGVAVGYSTSGQFRERAAYVSSVETSIYLDPESRNQGIGSKLYNELFRILEQTEVHRAYGGVTLPNISSIALHRKFGFSEVGVYNEVGFKFGKYHSVCWLEKKLRS